MASRSLRVGQGRIGFIVAAVLLATACSSDSSVSFDPDVPGGDDDMAASGSSNGTSGKGNASSGSSNGTAGNDSDPTAGSDSVAGKQAGGAGTGGTATSGGKNSGNGGSAGNGVAGQAGGTGGSSAGMAGMPNGGSAGTAGTGAGGTSAGMAGMGGVAGTSGSGGTAGAGGSSGGSCTTSAFGGHNYAFCGAVDSATAAYQKCQALGMQLASIESKMENDYLAGKIKSASWLGASDELEEGEWRWVSSTLVFWDGKKVDGMYVNWIDGQPNNMDNSGAPENCLVLTASGWNDIACDKKDIRPLCESTGPVIGPGFP